MYDPQLEPARDYRDYADPSSDIDLIADGGKPCRAIMPLGDGNLVLTNLAGTDRTIAVTQNVREDVQAIAVKAATNIPLRIYW